MRETLAIIVLTGVHLNKKVLGGVEFDEAAGWTRDEFEGQEIFSRSYPATATKLLAFLHDKGIFFGEPAGEVPALVAEFLKRLISHEKRSASATEEVLVIAHKGSVFWDRLKTVSAYATFTAASGNVGFKCLVDYLRDPSELNLCQLLLLARRARLIQRFARVRTSLEVSKRIDGRLRRRAFGEVLELDGLVVSIYEGNCYSPAWKVTFRSKWEELKRKLGEEESAPKPNRGTLLVCIKELTKLLDEGVVK